MRLCAEHNNSLKTCLFIILTTTNIYARLFVFNSLQGFFLFALNRMIA